MTEQVQNFSADQGQPASVSNTVSTPAPVQSEKTFTQTDLDRLAGKIREESYQKGVRDAISKNQQPVEPAYQQQAPAMQQTAQPTQYVGGMPQQSPEQIRAMIAEEQQKFIQQQQKLAQDEYLQGLAKSFISKVEAGKSKYEDFDSVATALNLPQIPAIWQAAEKFDNPADIVYHLGKNPGKLAQLLTVAYSQELVKRGMQELSDSLKQNEVAKQQNKPNAPLSRPEPSNIGMGNGDKNMTAQDWKKIRRV